MEILKIPWIRRCLLMMIGAAVVVGCGNPFGGGSSQIDPDHQPGVTQGSSVPPAKDSELISSSGQSVHTTDGKYIVSSSLGGPLEGLQGTTAHGYIYYLNIQGQIISSTPSP
jgi:hypothetical protein